jgi:hypothetical protein
MVRYVPTMGMPKPSLAKWTESSETSPAQVVGSFVFDAVGQEKHKVGYLLSSETGAPPVHSPKGALYRRLRDRGPVRLRG